MNCKFCNRPISHTFASLFLFKEVHIACELFLKEQENVAVYPFLEGVIIADYLVERLPHNADKDYLVRRYMTLPIKRAINEKSLILLLEEEPSNEALYLIFLLSGQRLYWVFLERPNFLE